MFTIPSCPYCQKALRYAGELRRENPAYASLTVEVIDEQREPALADQYDYYYVPAYYAGGRKLHEGAASREDVRTGFDAALGLKR